MQPAAAPAMPSILLLALLAATALGAGAVRTPTLVFILAGQSNMGGRGGATLNNRWDGVVPRECAPSPRTLRLSPALRWEEAREPLHSGIDVGNVLGVGPGIPFAHALLRAPACPKGAVVGLVPCAQGGTPIANWSRGSHLYDRMLTRARAAVAGTNGKGRVAAMLWFQGETDTIRREDALAYTGRMEALIRDVRRDLGIPNLLVIQVCRCIPCRDRDGAGQVRGSGAEGAAGGAGAQPEVRGRHGPPRRQRLHAPHHAGAGPAGEDARRRLRRHA
uniref:Sialate O-acetylesterase domain-containing protein n=1 Tax=Aegilops tauschii subsp. strangulata TaxID=200361 RepID=A0A453MKQ4_AEGTS